MPDEELDDDPFNVAKERKDNGSFPTPHLFLAGLLDPWSWMDGRRVTTFIRYAF